MSSNVDKKKSEAEEKQARRSHSNFVADGHSWSGNERNCLFLNHGGKQFSTASYVTGFDFKDDSRGIALVDWDHDGDLDVWMSNRYGPQVRYLENQIKGTKWMSLKLAGDGVKVNLDAIGAKVIFWINENGKEVPLKRDVHCGGSFLSQSTRWLNVGTGDGELQRIEVRWPDGTKQEFPSAKINHHYTLKYGENELQEWKRVSEYRLASEKQAEPSLENIGMRLIKKYPMPPMKLFGSDKKAVKLEKGRVRLLKFWSATCEMCEKELETIESTHELLSKNGIDLILVNVDVSPEGKPEFNQANTSVVPQLSMGIQGINSVELFMNTVRIQRAQFRFPLNFLIDAEGNVISYYEGTVNYDLILKDALLAHTSVGHRYWNAIPFIGILESQRIEPLNDVLATEYGNIGYNEYAEELLEGSGDGYKKSVPYKLNLAAIYLRTGRAAKAIPLLEGVLEISKDIENKRQATRNIGIAYLETKQLALAEEKLSLAGKTYDDAQSYYYLAKVMHKMRRSDEVEGYLFVSIGLCEKQNLTFRPPWKSLASAYKRAGRQTDLDDLLKRAQKLGIKL